MINSSVNVTLFHPEQYQREVIDSIANNWKDSIHVVKAVRQCGKSLMTQNLLCYYSLTYPNQKSIFLSPTNRQAREQMKSIDHNMKKLIRHANYQTLELEFINGSRIIFLSAESGDNLRGDTITPRGLLIVDESAYIQDNVFWAAVPFTQANNAPIILISTPRWRRGFFYDFFNTPPGQNVYSYDWSLFDNPYLTPTKREMIRSKMPENLYRCDYLGEWLDMNSDVFGEFKDVVQDYKYNGGGNLWRSGLVGQRRRRLHSHHTL